MAKKKKQEETAKNLREQLISETWKAFEALDTLRSYCDKHRTLCGTDMDDCMIEPWCLDKRPYKWDTEGLKEEIRLNLAGDD